MNPDRPLAGHNRPTYIDEPVPVSSVIQSNSIISLQVSSAPTEPLSPTGFLEFPGPFCESKYNPSFPGNHLSLNPAPGVSYVTPAQAKNLAKTYCGESGPGLASAAFKASTPSTVQGLLMLSHEASNRHLSEAHIKVETLELPQGSASSDDRPSPALANKAMGKHKEVLSGRTILGKMHLDLADFIYHTSHVKGFYLLIRSGLNKG